jgi:CRP-like cAMP-binding protein
MNFTTNKIGAILDISHRREDSSSSAASHPSRPSLEIRARALEAENSETAGAHNLLSSGEQVRLLQDATPLIYRHGGSTLYSEHQSASFLFVVYQGIIRISRCAENGRRQILAFRISGDLLGLPENGRYVNSAETVGPAKVYRIPWQRMQQAMLAEPQIQLHLFMKVADDFRHAEDRIMSLGQQNTCQRLVSLILDFIHLPEFFDDERSLLMLPVSRFDLADYLGTVTKSLERAFARLESQGVIRRRSSRSIEILDMHALQHLHREERRGQH